MRDIQKKLQDAAIKTFPAINVGETYVPSKACCFKRVNKDTVVGQMGTHVIKFKISGFVFSKTPSLILREVK